jgi:hypothetical protein
MNIKIYSKAICTTFAILILSACSAIMPITDVVFPAKYDSNEYEMVNWIRTSAELAVDSCDNNDVSRQNIVNMYRAALEFKNFTQHQRRNQKTHELATNLYQLVDNSLSLYAESDQVSVVFCELSFDQIATTAETVQKVIGDKPR